MRRLTLSLMFLGLAGVRCIGPFPWDPPREATLAKFTSAQEMLTYLSDQVTTQARSSDYYFPGIGDVSFAAEDVSNAGSAASGSGDSFSTTNLQEAGVDESDVIKNDATFIYVAKGKSLRIVQAVPADALAEVGRLDLSVSIDSLYLTGNRMVALGRNSGSSATIVTLIDVTDRANPIIQQTWQFEAYLATSRLIGDRLHLVMTQTPRISYGNDGNPIPLDSLDKVLPTYQTGASGGEGQKAIIADWSAFYHPIDQQGYGLTLVTTIDLAHPSDPPQSVGITASAGVIYASPSALYVTSPQSGYWYDQRTSDTTQVHKFDLRGDHAVYVGGASVPGHLLNQYSLGEKDGYLRLGISVGQVVERFINGSNPTSNPNDAASNAVYVLGESATQGQLDIVGSAENIAPGEKIYSARFVGNRGFLVTFRALDPLFTLDMSDPTNPQVVGQLEIPGYSQYIHPMDANHLLTIGHDAYYRPEYDASVPLGVQLSLFDVSDFAHPQLLAKEIIGVRGTESEANQNPKAFNYFAQKEALAIPISVYEGPSDSPLQSGTHTFDGLYVYHVTVDDGFMLIGQISTSQSLTGSYYYYGHPTRGIFIGDSVYAVSDTIVTAAPTADPSRVQSSVILE